jgi:sulfur-oxidizing protein SoxY
MLVQPMSEPRPTDRIAKVGAAMNTQPRLHRRTFLALVAVCAAARRAAAQTPPGEGSWPALAAQIFSGRPVQDGAAILGIDAPYRAEDAALVPVGLRSLLAADDNRQVRRITLVIDENPSPLAAVFSPTPASGLRSLSTRVRIDDYTNVHAVAELSDGQLYAAARFVKAAGGCSAPAAKLEADAIPLGTMRFRQFPAAEGAAPGLREAQLLIRHPNYTGMQMDQLTRLYVPAHFVNSVRIWQGDDLLLAIEGGISISENPAFRFDYRPNGAASFRAQIDDSEGKSFKQEWPVARV